MKQSQLTIADIARLAGVSKKSVSRVINGEAGVSDATRANIRAIIEAQGYEPDRRARALAGNRSFLLGVAYDNPNAAYVLELLQGAVRAANGHGYEVVMHPVDEAAGEIAARLDSFMRRSGCDGLVLTPPLSEAPGLVSRIAQRPWPAVRIAGDDVALEIPQIRYDDRSAALAITRHLIDLGHRRIGFVGGPEHGGSTGRRLAGFRDALSARGLELRSDHQGWGDFTFLSGLAAGRRMLALAARPSAVMCCNDEMAAGVIHAAREAGLGVPDDLSVTGFDDSHIAQEMWPPLTTVRQPVGEMGAAAVEALLGSMAGTKPAGRRDYAHDVVVRLSTAAPRS